MSQLGFVNNFLSLFICFYIQMHECASFIINSFDLFQRTLFNKRANENKQVNGRGQAYLYAHSVKNVS